uniref:Uncharacterized protein n=1 Tax=Paramormyrops kingsleyae TaxID=1676925 RepID=A0A3B3RI03_9TELE
MACLLIKKGFSPLRANEDFRLTFMFGDEEKSLKFIDVLSEQKPKILGSLTQMEACAVQLDKMKKGADISGVAGSTVGVGAGVVFIVGLALAPVTLGASSILILVGGVLGAVSGVNSVTTGITEAAINSRKKKNFSEIYQKFLEDLEPIYKCLAQVIIIKGPSVENDIVHDMTNAGKVMVDLEPIYKYLAQVIIIRDPSVENDVIDHMTKVAKVGGSVGSVCRGIDVALDCGNVIKFTDAASDLAEIGGVAKAAPTAFSMPFRAAFIAVNSALIGLDLFSIVNNSISLANGSKSDVSKAIQGHVDFWKIHLDAWDCYVGCLCISVNPTGD